MLPDPNLINKEQIIISVSTVKNDGKIETIFYSKEKENEVYIWKVLKGVQVVRKEGEKINQEQFIEFVNNI